MDIFIARSPLTLPLVFCAFVLGCGSDDGASTGDSPFDQGALPDAAVDVGADAEDMSSVPDMSQEPDTSQEVDLGPMALDQTLPDMRMAKPCAQDQHVKQGSCIPCGPSATRPAGDNPDGQDTQCDPVLCEVNTSVIDNQCVVCPVGLSNASGDDASGADTSCGPANARTIAVGGFHSCAVTPAETVECWGLNSSGQLGDGTGISRSTPKEVSGLQGIISVVAGERHTCALDGQGQVWCWGANTILQLGIQGIRARGLPDKLASLGSGNKQLVAGDWHTCAISSQDKIVCWGWNRAAQLGHASRTEASLPAEVVFKQDQQGAFVHLGAGFAHTCALRQDGKVLCWGVNDFGQTSARVTTLGYSTAFEAQPVPRLSGVTSLGVGRRASCALVASGDVRCWGNGAPGTLGGGDFGVWSALPISALPLQPGVLSVTVGGDTACVLAPYGPMCWGYNGAGQIGDGTFESQPSPVSARLLQTAYELVPGLNHSCVRVDQGEVECWGSNADGQLGTGGVLYRGGVVPQQSLPTFAPDSLVIGGSHMCGVDLLGDVWCRGENLRGQLGTGSVSSSEPFTRVQGLGAKATKVALGLATTCAVLENGSLKCWGSGQSGQLGNGLQQHSAMPVDADIGPAKASDVALGDAHTCALLASKEVMCWGENAAGQLAASSPPLSTAPLAVRGIRPASSIHAARERTCIITDSAAVQCWGLSAQFIPEGTTTITPTIALPPKTIALGGVVDQLTLGQDHSCALMATGQVRCWGANNVAQIARAAQNASVEPPALITSLGSEVVQLAATSTSTCAKMSDQSVRCWGANDAGQLGTSISIPVPTPLQVPSINTPGTLSAGGLNVCHQETSTGSVVCWGRADSRMLGEGFTLSSFTPMPLTP